MELIRRKAQVELNERHAMFIEQLCEQAWKMGAIRSPEDGEHLQELRARIKAAFPAPTPPKPSPKK